MNEWTLYLITRLDSIKCLLIFSSFISSAALIMFLCFSAMEDDWTLYKKYRKKILLGLSILITLTVAVPDQKEALAIWLIPKAVNNETLTNLSADSIDLLSEYIKEQLDQLNKENK